MVQASTLTRAALLTAAAIAAASASAAPLKIALIETMSGPSAAAGQLYQNGLKYEIDRINAAGGWNGEPIQVLYYDNLGGTVGASDRFRAAVADGAQIVLQGASSAIAAQLIDDVRKHNTRNPGNEVMYMNIGSEALDLTAERCNFYSFRMFTNMDMRVKALMSTMSEKGTLGKRVYSINQNFSAGHDMERLTDAYAKQYGYEVVGKALHDVNKLQDFSPYVARMKEANPDTVVTMNWSTDLLLLVKAIKESGLKVRLATINLDAPGTLANAGEAALGHYLAQPSNMEAAGAAGEKLAADYKAKTGHLPFYIEPQAIVAAGFLNEALRKVKAENGRLPVTKLALAMEDVVYDTPFGVYKLRKGDHQMLPPIVVSEVSKDAKYKADNGPMGFKPIKTIDAATIASPVSPACKMQRPS